MAEAGCTVHVRPGNGHRETSQLLENLMTRKFKELQLQQSHDGRHQAQTIAYSFI